jgi:hypothetical protein
MDKPPVIINFDVSMRVKMEYSMRKESKSEWEKLIKEPAQIMKELEPAMSIFLGTGVGEPRILVKLSMSTDSAHLKDLEPIQLVSLGDAISVAALNTNA